MYSTRSISARGSDKHLHLSEDETCLPRFAWGRHGLYLAPELIREEAELVSVL